MLNRPDSYRVTERRKVRPRNTDGAGSNISLMVVCGLTNKIQHNFSSHVQKNQFPRNEFSYRHSEPNLIPMTVNERFHNATFRYKPNWPSPA